MNPFTDGCLSAFDASGDVRSVGQQNAGDFGLAPADGQQLQDGELPQAVRIVAGPFLVDGQHETGSLALQIDGLSVSKILMSGQHSGYAF